MKYHTENGDVVTNNNGNNINQKNHIRSPKSISKNNYTMNTDKIKRKKQTNIQLLSLPSLIHHRQTGVWPSSISSSNSHHHHHPFRPISSSLWIDLLLKRDSTTTTGNTTNTGGTNPIPKKKKEWRPYARRLIPFTKMRTPSDLAVLALDRTGGYLVCLGSSSDVDVTTRFGGNRNMDWDSGTSNSNSNSNGRWGLGPRLALSFRG